MNKFKLKSIVKLCVPIIFLNFYGYAKAYAFVLLNRKILSRNNALKGIHNGKTVYIIGNGPSLNNFELKSIVGENVITMNFFGLHPLKDAFNIVAHCVGEPYNSSTWQNPELMLDGISSDTYWFNSDALEYFSRNPQENIYYYLQGIKYNSVFSAGSNLSKVALCYQSTSQMAINIAMYMGFSKIYLLGLDHDWLAERNISQHFYATDADVPQEDLSQLSYLQKIKNSLELFEIYNKILKNAILKKVYIFNLSNPSYLDVFPSK